MNPVIQAHQLSRRFGETLALDGLGLEVAQGEVFGFLGHNGAGKTTTVRLLNGVLEPTSGQAVVLGLSPTRDGPALRRRTGVLTETPAVDERLSARENLEIYARLYGLSPAQARARAAQLLEQFGLAGRADERVGGYSKGMKQRLALARVLLHDPELIFLDEPTSGLDPVAAREVHELIRGLQAAGRTVFLTTHNLAEAQLLCHRVAVLERGRLRAIGTPEELARRLGGVRLVLEVTPAALPAALSLLPKAERLENGSLAVPGVRREEVPVLVSRLAAGGVGLYRVSLEEPSLEDVYFALHAEEAP
ncbi:Fluoroquinolones export ATP-binding protein [Calidithermus terrae]|uniref:Fluoroquinolones export ATP-binding protein n=1 Tax=Calidithermus terrae TaxID=1408545 RepID=A0A399EP50_9DEIN|nr:ABC transporter ATP-binding protein [Calidithermus terrae]RIH83921.1 Fluoroquinolones export ATP-binding protein [Calidithermus terrae]